MNTDGTPLLSPGGYRELRSYKVTEAVCDAAVVFCRRLFPHDCRMTEQMVRAARSGVRNISEASGAAAMSRRRSLAVLAEFVGSAAPETAGNAMVCAVNQAACLLKPQIESQDRAFLKTGGFSETLYRARQHAREQHRSDKPEGAEHRRHCT